MASINISAIIFIPGMEFTFGSFNFIAGVDGRLHVSDQEATSIGQIIPDLTDHVIITRLIFEPNSDRSETDSYRPGTSLDSVIQLTRFNACSARLWKINPNALRTRANVADRPELADQPTTSAEQSTSSIHLDYLTTTKVLSTASSTPQP